MNKLDVLTRRLQEFFPDDPSAPSVLLAWIPDKAHFYCSLVRYTEPFGRGKEVVHKCNGQGVEECVDQMLVTLGVDPNGI